MNTAAGWRVRTEPGGLPRADPGPDRGSLRSALEDCADTLSPIGEAPALSTYWVDRLLAQLEEPSGGEIAHGNLWVLTIREDVVEVRMDVDPPDSPALDEIAIEEMVEGLKLLRREVVGQTAAGHALEPGRFWAQRNPYP